MIRPYDEPRLLLCVLCCFARTKQQAAHRAHGGLERAVDAVVRGGESLRHHVGRGVCDRPGWQ